MASGVVGQHLAQLGTTLAAELQRATPLARVCAIKGLVSSMPAEAGCCAMQLEQTGVQSLRAWVPLVDGALVHACLAMEQAADAQMKHQALQLLVSCLQRIRKLLQVTFCMWRQQAGLARQSNSGTLCFSTV